MVAALVAAALAPVAVGPDPPATALVALLGATGGGYLSEFVKGVIGRVRGRDGGGPGSEAEVREALERELLARLQAQGQDAAEWRAAAGALLESVQGTQAALEAAASDEVRLALTGAFAEFRGMLDESLQTLTAIQRTQRYHTDQGRQMLVMLELLVGRHTPVTAVEPVEEGEVCPYMGLAAFQAEDARWFFGRDRLVAELVVRLAEAPFLAVIGPSGSG
jgi:transcription antitermination factor NusG